MNPLVTVIIPNYNHELYLKQRIDSVLKQTHTNFEVILLDDASTDGSLEILNNYNKHPKVLNVLVNEINSGSVFKQWIKGIELANGEYIWIAESDDFAHPDFLKEMIAMAELDEKVGLVFSDSMIINKTGEGSNQSSNSNKVLANFIETKQFKIEDKNTIFDYFIADLIIWNASSVLFKTKMIKNVNFEVLKTLKNAGDLFVYISIAFNQYIFYLNKPLNYMRIHGANTTQKSLASGVLFKDRINVIQYFLDELLKLSGSKEHLQLFLRRHFLTSVDMKLYPSVNNLLESYYKLNIIKLSSYFSLSFYIVFCRAFRKAPNLYRNKIKKVLANIR